MIEDKKLRSEFNRERSYTETTESSSDVSQQQSLPVNVGGVAFNVVVENNGQKLEKIRRIEHKINAYFDEMSEKHPTWSVERKLAAILFQTLSELEEVNEEHHHYRGEVEKRVHRLMRSINRLEEEVVLRKKQRQNELDEVQSICVLPPFVQSPPELILPLTEEPQSAD